MAVRVSLEERLGSALLGRVAVSRENAAGTRDDYCFQNPTPTTFFHEPVPSP